MFDDLINQAAINYQVPVPWIQAVIQTESSWNPNAHNASDPSGAWGLMQILYTTARALGYTGAAEGLFDPAVNIDLGTKLLGQLRASYGDDFRRVYSAYNSGKPDLWETSSQVAAHVATAVGNLQQWLSTEVEAITAQPANSGLALAIGALLLWAWMGRKKK